MRDDYKVSVAQVKLDASAKTREQLLAKWGFEPTSMWYFTKIHDKSLDSLVQDTLAQGSYVEHNYNCRDGALSQTNPQVVERLVKFFTEPGETTLNPFCGRAMYNLVANYFGRNSIGQDVCQEFMQHNFEKIKRRVESAGMLDDSKNKIIKEDSNHLFTLHKGCRLDMILGDSRHLEVEDNSIDFITTSPPYWNLEIYGAEEPEQIGRGKGTGKGDMPTYEEFLGGLQEIMKECYRVLKPNKYMAVIVNDFRVKNKFYLYHADTIRICEEAGWKMHDMIIYNLSVHPLQSIFTSQMDRDKHMAKQHEYIIIFKKE